MARTADLDAARADADATPLIKGRHVAAAVVGNWLEFYDFTVFAYFAVQIGDAFFPSESDFAKVMLSLVTFGAGFICRPIGAIVIGRYADRVGRRPAMLLSFAMMGGALLGLVFVPPFSAIGVLAPILAVTLRVIQGFALGGEVGPTTAYLIEAAPPGRRGFYGAWQSASQSLASLLGGFVGATLANVLSPGDFSTYGWRIAFLIGTLVLPVGFVIRRSLPETLRADETKLEAHPDAPLEGGQLAMILSHWRIVLLGLGLITGGTISTYVIFFMPTYAQTMLHMDPRIALWLPVATGIAGFFASLLGGHLSDRLGRRPLMIWPRVAFMLAIVPVFLLVSRQREIFSLLALMFGLNFLSNLAGVPALVAVTESMRKEVRGLGVATVYATAVAVFGGTTQPVVHWLDHVTGSPMAIAWYTTAATLVALVASILMVETVRRPARRLP